MDPNMDGHITRVEMKEAFKRAHLPPNALITEFLISKVMAKFESFMHDHQMKIEDLFASINKDDSGSIDAEEFEEGLKRMIHGASQLAKVLKSSKEELLERFASNNS